MILLRLTYSLDYQAVLYKDNVVFSCDLVSRAARVERSSSCSMFSTLAMIRFKVSRSRTADPSPRNLSFASLSERGFLKLPLGEASSPSKLLPPFIEILILQAKRRSFSAVGSALSFIFFPIARRSLSRQAVGSR